MEKKKQIVLKHNPVIRGYFENKDSGNITILNEFDFDLLNAMYYNTQQNLFTYETIEYKNHRKRTFFVRDIKKTLKINSNAYIDMIKESLNRIYNVEINLKDYKDPESGRVYEWKKTRIITSIAKFKDSDNEFEIEFTEDFIASIMRHPKPKQLKEERTGNFTPIDIKEVRGIKSKYGKRLYEYLKSLKGKGMKNYVVLDIEALNRLYGTNHTALSRLTEITKRIYKQVNEKFPFEYEVYKEDKKICFKFDKQRDWFIVNISIDKTIKQDIKLSMRVFIKEFENIFLI